MGEVLPGINFIVSPWIPDGAAMIVTSQGTYRLQGGKVELVKPGPNDLRCTVTLAPWSTPTEGAG